MAPMRSRCSRSKPWASSERTSPRICSMESVRVWRSSSRLFAMDSHQVLLAAPATVATAPSSQEVPPASSVPSWADGSSPAALLAADALLGLDARALPPTACKTSSSLCASCVFASLRVTSSCCPTCVALLSSRKASRMLDSTFARIATSRLLVTSHSLCVRSSETCSFSWAASFCQSRCSNCPWASSRGLSSRRAPSFAAASRCKASSFQAASRFKASTLAAASR
mmetsp:Transcript_37932/g.120541  ORF Transcript_37932/g.120541 Transcript_37932/m.120541 type:complete len:226 (-) Transcript_37932:226-903(-)